MCKFDFLGWLCRGISRAGTKSNNPVDCMPFLYVREAIYDIHCEFRFVQRLPFCHPMSSFAWDLLAIRKDSTLL